MLLRRLLLVATAAQHAAATPLAPSYTSASASKAYTCAEAKEHDEIIFDCGGEFISKARTPPPHVAARGRTHATTAAVTARLAVHPPLSRTRYIPHWSQATAVS